MAINEVFPNPTVKQVVFEIKFPNLFFLESKIGDLQTKLMTRFPEASLLHRRKIIVADVGPETRVEDLPSPEGAERTIWQFKSPDECVVNVTTNSLDISSAQHKTYKQGDGPRFRDLIECVVDPFLQVTQLPIIRRLGLRYIDECPITAKDDNTLKEWYNSAFPSHRFSMSETEEMHLKLIVKRCDLRLIYQEALSEASGKPTLTLDFDGFATDILATDYLSTADKIHTMVNEEYDKSINEPLKKYMRVQPSQEQ